MIGYFGSVESNVLGNNKNEQLRGSNSVHRIERILLMAILSLLFAEFQHISYSVGYTKWPQILFDSSPNFFK